MSITDDILDDMYQEHKRDMMREHHNAITSTEVEMKFDKVCSEVRALENYLACFEREWGVRMVELEELLKKYRGLIDEIKINFINKTYNIGR